MTTATIISSDNHQRRRPSCPDRGDSMARADVRKAGIGMVVVVLVTQLVMRSSRHKNVLG